MGRKGRVRFEVVVTRPRTTDSPLERVVSGAQTTDAAYRRLVEVIQQWAASEGAITPGTTVSIVDTNDGGHLLTMQYLGFEANLLREGSQPWPGPERHPRRQLKAWPK